MILKVLWRSQVFLPLGTDGNPLETDHVTRMLCETDRLNEKHQLLLVSYF